MSMFDASPTTPPVLRADLPLLDEGQLAAAAFLDRYSGRTLEAYRTDLRQYFQWAADVGMQPLDATRGHIELYRARMEDKGLAPATIPPSTTGDARTTTATLRTPSLRSSPTADTTGARRQHGAHLSGNDIRHDQHHTSAPAGTWRPQAVAPGGLA